MFYHSNFLGRGHGPVLLLEDAGASYKRLPKDGLTDAKVFAMPAIRLNGTRVISQTVAILMALGTEFGYAPPAGMEPEALKLALDLADVWSERWVPQFPAPDHVHLGSGLTTPPVGPQLRRAPRHDDCSRSR